MPIILIFQRSVPPPSPPSPSKFADQSPLVTKRSLFRSPDLPEGLSLSPTVHLGGGGGGRGLSGVRGCIQGGIIPNILGGFVTFKDEEVFPAQKETVNCGHIILDC
jgi:hypothetical protein